MLLSSRLFDDRIGVTTVEHGDANSYVGGDHHAVGFCCVLKDNDPSETGRRVRRSRKADEQWDIYFARSERSEVPGYLTCQSEVQASTLLFGQSYSLLSRARWLPCGFCKSHERERQEHRGRSAQ